MTSSARLLWELSESQHGVVTARQLRRHGLTAGAIRHRLGTGRLHPLWRGVYAVGRPQVSREGRWLAATLACGPHAGVSGDDALVLYGIRAGLRRGPIHVSVPRAERHAHRGIRVHRIQIERAGVSLRAGIPVVSPAWALLGRATRVSPRQLEADVNAVDIHGLITPVRLRESLEDFRGLRGVAALRRLLDDHTFTVTDSELERMFLPLARSAGLGQPRTRRRVNGFRVDFFWPELGLVVETDGLRYHRTAAQQTRDLRREQTHRAAGLEPLRFSHWQVAYDKRWVLETLRRVANRLRERSR